MPYAGNPTQQPARKKRRVFLWFFLALQLLFVAWIWAGMAADTDVCATATNRSACEAGAEIGGGLAIAFMFGMWLFVDLLVGVIYGVYRLAKRT